MKTDAELMKIVEEMNGKNKEEIEEILVREGVLVPVERGQVEFKVTYTKKNLWERIKEMFR